MLILKHCGICGCFKHIFFFLNFSRNLGFPHVSSYGKSLLRKWVGLLYWCGFLVANDSSWKKKWLILGLAAAGSIIPCFALLDLPLLSYFWHLFHLCTFKNTYKQLPRVALVILQLWVLQDSWRFLSVSSSEQKIIILKAELIHQNLIENLFLFSQL